MGLGPFEAEFLLAEHQYKPITGRMLTISRQTVTMTPDKALELLRETNTPVRPEAKIAIDDKTRGHKTTQELISDDSFYALFSDAKLSVLDVSDYEGADVIHDMNVPIGPDLEGQFDFVICGSCLDNIFDPVTAMRNLSRLVKPGGRLFSFEWGAFPTGYLGYSPDWFLDYYAVNRFADCKVYTLQYPGKEGPSSAAPSFDMYYYDPVVEHSGMIGYQCSNPQYLRYYLSYVIAEKGSDSTWNASPIQMHYRTSDAERKVYVDSALQYKASPRPLFRREGRPINGDPELSRFGTLKPVASWDTWKK